MVLKIYFWKFCPNASAFCLWHQIESKSINLIQFIGLWTPRKSRFSNKKNMFEFPKPSGRWEDGDTAVKALVLSIKDDATYEPTEAWGVQTCKTNQPLVATQTMLFFSPIFHPENWGRWRYEAIWTVAYFSKGVGEKPPARKSPSKPWFFWGDDFLVSWEIHVGSQMPGNI